MAWDDGGTTAALTAAHNNQIVNGGGGRGIGEGTQQSQNSEWERGGERWRRIKRSWSMVIIVPCQKNSILSQRFGANYSERMEFFCAGHMPSLTYLSTIRKYYSTSSTSSYVCTRRHVGNSQKRHDIDGPKMEQERQMSLNVGPTFSDMSPTCLRHVNVASKLPMPTSNKPN